MLASACSICSKFELQLSVHTFFQVFKLIIIILVSSNECFLDSDALQLGVNG